MSWTCANCGGKIGVFGKLKSGSCDECGAVLCADCVTGSMCKTCSCTYCQKHINKHECVPQEENSDEEDDMDEEEPDEWLEMEKIVKTMTAEQLLQFLVLDRIREYSDFDEDLMQLKRIVGDKR